MDCNRPFDHYQRSNEILGIARKDGFASNVCFLVCLTSQMLFVVKS